jgi:hypothetical protein
VTAYVAFLSNSLNSKKEVSYATLIASHWKGKCQWDHVNSLRSHDAVSLEASLKFPPLFFVFVHVSVLQVPQYGDCYLKVVAEPVSSSSSKLCQMKCNLYQILFLQNTVDWLGLQCTAQERFDIQYTTKTWKAWLNLGRLMENLPPELRPSCPAETPPTMYKLTSNLGSQKSGNLRPHQRALSVCF